MHPQLMSPSGLRLEFNQMLLADGFDDLINGNGRLATSIDHKFAGVFERTFEGQVNFGLVMFWLTGDDSVVGFVDLAIFELLF